MSVEIIIDDRETAVIPFFNEFPNPSAQFKVERINFGDYAVMYDDKILIIIERKTWKDLSASIKDGRKHNIEKLKKIRSDTGCQIFYLIEGNPIPKSTTKFARIPHKNLQAHLDHLILRDNVRVIYSKNQKGTVFRIFELVRNYLSIQPPLINLVEAAGGVEQLKKQVVSEEANIYKLWCAIPNITEKTASIFIEKKYHISDLFLKKITKDEIYALKYPNNYVIGKRSEKIWKALSEPETHIKVLQQIKGITKQTAEILQPHFLNIMKGTIQAEELSKIKKKKKCLGKVVAGRIIKYLQPST